MPRPSWRWRTLFAFDRGVDAAGGRSRQPRDQTGASGASAKLAGTNALAMDPVRAPSTRDTGTRHAGAHDARTDVGRGGDGRGHAAAAEARGYSLERRVHSRLARACGPPPRCRSPADFGDT